MSQWDGQSKGAVLGYKIFIFLIRKLGVKSAYFLLYFVAFYYLLFSVKANKALYCYFNKRLGYGKFKSILHIYKSTFSFGQSMIDRVAISNGMSHQFSFEHDGGERIQALLKGKKGGILISAHVGNFELAEHFFSEMNSETQINLVTTDNERRAIKEYMESVSVKSNIKFIIVNENMSHIYEINEVLNANELICLTGDRYFEGNKLLSTDLLGQKAEFPAGPFVLGSRLRVPVLFVYVMKETSTHYHLYAREAEFKRGDAQGLLNQYAKSVEWILSKYPYQWFNFFDFWNDLK